MLNRIQHSSAIAWWLCMLLGCSCFTWASPGFAQVTSVANTAAQTQAQVQPEPELQPELRTKQPAQAGNPEMAEELRRFAAPVLRQRYYALLDELRCPKCQNQNLADSDAPIATDLRNELFRLLHENYNDSQIKEYMVARFGSFVLYSPPASGYTAVLWLLPALLLVASAALIWRITRKPTPQEETNA